MKPGFFEATQMAWCPDERGGGLREPASPTTRPPSAAALSPLGVMPLFANTVLPVAPGHDLVLGRNRQSRIRNSSLCNLGRSVSRRHITVRPVISFADAGPPTTALEAEVHAAAYLQRWGQQGSEEQGETLARHGSALKLQAGSTVQVHPQDCLWLLKKGKAPSIPRANGHHLFGFQVCSSAPAEAIAAEIHSQGGKKAAASADVLPSRLLEQSMQAALEAGAEGAAAVETPAPAAGVKRSAVDTTGEASTELGQPPAKRALLQTLEEEAAGQGAAEEGAGGEGAGGQWLMAGAEEGKAPAGHAETAGADAAVPADTVTGQALSWEEDEPLGEQPQDAVGDV
ncbi:hypothetical protein ACK3TF_000192 [Chlorella vulgaris]